MSRFTSVPLATQIQAQKQGRIPRCVTDPLRINMGPFLNRIEQRYRMSIYSGISINIARDKRAEEMKKNPNITFDRDLGIDYPIFHQKYDKSYKTRTRNWDKIKDHPKCEEFCEVYTDLNPITFTFSSLPKNIMDDIISQFSPTIDCCASPYDNLLPKFCSIHPNVDKDFGSIGNFLDIDVKHFENQVLWIHPPNIELIVSKMIERVHFILNSVTCICLIVIPSWDDMLNKIQSYGYNIEIICNCNQYDMHGELYDIQDLVLMKVTNQ